MKHAALGFRAHSGWTALVAVSLEGKQLRILGRQRPKLVEEFTYEFRQPYHTAEKMGLDKAREFIGQIESAATRLAEATIRSIQIDLQKQGYRVTCFGLPLASGRTLPELEKVLLSHALVHTADGELFRRALMRASERCELAAFTPVERELVSHAGKALKMKKDDLLVRLSALGKPMGPPWSQDEKLATMAAWLALLQHSASSSD